VAIASDALESEGIGELETFLPEAHERIVALAGELSGASGFVPAAAWDSYLRGLLLEHLQAEVDTLIGGVAAEALWEGFTGLHATAPLVELISTGMHAHQAAHGRRLSGPARRAGTMTS